MRYIAVIISNSLYKVIIVAIIVEYKVGSNFSFLTWWVKDDNPNNMATTYLWPQKEKKQILLSQLNFIYVFEICTSVKKN